MTAAAIREQLARIIDNPLFTSSARLSRFLAHVVERTIDGKKDDLKEFSIAMEVFDRSSEYDPNIDAIVRVQARRLRAKLKAYYEGSGKDDSVLIALRPGSYVPIFRCLPSRRESQPLADTPALPVGVTSVAVLPFVNMSPEPEQDFFCDGITEEIINSLAHISGLKVIARTSAFQFKRASVDIREVGQRLGADLVIEGSVRKAGDQLRITAQAVQAESGHHLWSETFRRELRDVFAIQEEIAKAVTRLLRVNMPELAGVRAHSENLDAYTRYLRTRFLVHQQSPETLRAALEQSRKLVEEYPDYAFAHSGVAAAQGLLALFGEVSGSAVYPEIKASAERGYRLDPDSAETCIRLSAVRGWFEHRWEEGATLTDRALRIQPGDAASHAHRGMTLLCHGDIKPAEQALRRSTELDPLSAADCARIAYLKYLQGDSRAAGEQLRKSFELDRDFPEARFYKALLQYREGDYASLTEFLSGSNAPLEIGLAVAAYARKDCLSCAREQARRLHQLGDQRYVSPLAEAFAAIGMDDFDLAFERLRQAIEDKIGFVNLLAVEPFFDPLRRDHRFTKLLKRLNLPTQRLITRAAENPSAVSA